VLSRIEPHRNERRSAGRRQRGGPEDVRPKQVDHTALALELDSKRFLTRDAREVSAIGRGAGSVVIVIGGVG
jgi:hypothetical protein